LKTSKKKKLVHELELIDQLMKSAEKDFLSYIAKVHPSNHLNAINLLHYLVLRNLDIRKVQDELHEYGLSSLASSESHIRGQLSAILERLGSKHPQRGNLCTYQKSKESQLGKLNGLFGKKSLESIPYIMVTLDEKHADDYASIKGLLQSGMNVARINCAHDTEAVWFRIIQHIKRASKITGLHCKIYMDLPGPKIRTVIKGGEKIKIKEGETLVFANKNFRAATNEKVIRCSASQIISQLQVGERILFDDGLLEARVEQCLSKHVRIQVLRISSKKPFIKAEKGINFPDSFLQIASLTEFDLKCLPFILKHADMVGYSFVRNEKDVAALRGKIHTSKKIAVIIKIETPEAVKNLPAILFESLKDENTGVMIARGDLAVEIGFERMSEIQEEILWICEAAHVPVIWATQVLENLNKSGIATRSEITDAAHAAQADCVMINKGSHTVKVIETLRDVLERIGGHHVKKRYTFRPLTIAKTFMASKAPKKTIS
jgi:pyruvate kinase